MKQSRVKVGLTIVLGAMAALAVAVGVALLKSSGSTNNSPHDTVTPGDSIAGRHEINELTKNDDASKPGATVPQPSDPEQEAIEDDTTAIDCIDEAANMQRVRAHVEQEVVRTYSLLFDHLGVTQSEKDRLTSLLAENQVARTHTTCKKGTTIDPQDRADSIEAIIGREKLARFLALEQHIYEYSEISYIDCVLDNSNRALTDVQRERLFEIIVGIAARKEVLPGADAERGSIQYLEYRLAEMNERTRLFLELAASELSTEQVGYLFDTYQRVSYQQADALERQKRARVDASQEPRPLYYPARSCMPRR